MELKENEWERELAEAMNASTNLLVGVFNMFDFVSYFI